MVASALGGQTALLALPTRSTETLDTFPLPVQLKIANTSGKKKGAGVLGNGMDVIKVAAVSKVMDFLVVTARMQFIRVDTFVILYFPSLCVINRMVKGKIGG